MIYLDTHIVVDLYEGRTGALSAEGRRVIDRDDDLRISPMVLLELQFLHEIRRLKRSGNVIVDALQQEIGLKVCERPFLEVVKQATRERWTRDPFDRMIVAQARSASAAIVTRDSEMRSHYALAVA